MNFSG